MDGAVTDVGRPGRPPPRRRGVQLTQIRAWISVRCPVRIIRDRGNGWTTPRTGGHRAPLLVLRSTKVTVVFDTSAVSELTQKNYNERLSSCENVLPGIERFCTDEEIVRLSRDVMRVDAAVASEDLEGRLVAGDIFEVAKYLPSEFIDLLIPDPPYNLSRNFNGNPFMTKGKNEYQSWSGISSIC